MCRECRSLGFIITFFARVGELLAKLAGVRLKSALLAIFGV